MSDVKMTSKAYFETVEIMELKLPDYTKKLRMVMIFSHQWVNVEVGSV